MQGLRTKLAVALLALGMTAAGMQAASAETLIKWREGIVPFKGDAGFFYMAKEKGFFRKHGIDVEFVQIPGNVKLVRALLAGTVDAIEASPGAMLKAILHGADIQFIGSTLPASPTRSMCARTSRTGPTSRARSSARRRPVRSPTSSRAYR